MSPRPKVKSVILKIRGKVSYRFDMILYKYYQKRLAKRIEKNPAMAIPHYLHLNLFIQKHFTQEELIKFSKKYIDVLEESKKDSKPEEPPLLN